MSPLGPHTTLMSQSLGMWQGNGGQGVGTGGHTTTGGQYGAGGEGVRGRGRGRGRGEHERDLRPLCSFSLSECLGDFLPLFLLFLFLWSLLPLFFLEHFFLGFSSSLHSLLSSSSSLSYLEDLVRVAVLERRLYCSSSSSE